IGRDHLANLAGFKQQPKPETVNTSVIADNGKIPLLRIAQGFDQRFGNTAQPEPADRRRHAVDDQPGKSLPSVRIDFVHCYRCSSSRKSVSSLIELTAFGFGNTRAGRPVQQPANSVPGRNERVQVYSSVDTQAIEHVENGFGGDIAGGALGVGAPAKPGNRAVEYLDAFQQPRVNIGQRLPVGIVKMAGQLITGNMLRNGFKQVARGAGRSGANG